MINVKKEKLRKKRQEMQIIFQDPLSSLNPRMTARLYLNLLNLIRQ